MCDSCVCMHACIHRKEEFALKRGPSALNTSGMISPASLALFHVHHKQHLTCIDTEGQGRCEDYGMQIGASTHSAFGPVRQVYV